MEDWNGQLDVSEMTGTVLLTLSASRAHLATVDGAEFGVVQALLARPMALLVHGFWVFDVANAHVLDLFRREKSKLDFLHRLERRHRLGEGRHAGRSSVTGAFEGGVGYWYEVLSHEADFFRELTL